MPTRPSVLVLTTTLPARAGDGTPEFVLTLAEALSTEADVTVVSPRVRGSEPTTRVGSVTILRVPYFPRRWEGLADGAILPNLRAQRWRLLEVPCLMVAMSSAGLYHAWRRRPQVVSAHWIVPSGLVALLIKRLIGVPYVLTAHGADAYALRSEPFQRIKSAVLRGADTVTPVSREIAEVLGIPSAAYVEVVVPMGVDVERITREVGVRTPVAGRFLFIGRLAEKKGVDVLLQALVEVERASAVILGDGPDREELERMSRHLGVDGRTAFLGRQPRIRVMEELRAAAAVVIPSREAHDGDRDGTPVVLAEAMAAGVAVVASRIGGIGEHVHHGATGLLVDPGDPEALATALRRVVDGGVDVDAIGRRGHHYARDHLDIRTTRDRYLAFLRTATGGRGAVG
jgi:glycosyltransferase involved in cell wall biosynthesis